MSFVVTIKNSFSDDNYKKIITAIRSSKMGNNTEILDTTKIEMSVRELKELYDYLFMRLKDDFNTCNERIN